MGRAAGTRLISDMGVSAQWLALREPADHAARDAGLLERAEAWLKPGAVVMDLGSGTGSTARAFGEAHWSWSFVDEDKDLLEKALSRHPDAEAHAKDIDQIDALPFGKASLVTASALLDLMPYAWVSALAAVLKKSALPLYAALNYNGIMRWTPALDGDEAVRAAFNAHQTTDKGLGPAMGPQSAAATQTVFQDHGYAVHLADSPWRLGPEHATLQAQLIEGIASAAHEMGCAAATAWAKARLAVLENTTAVIGHTDLFAHPVNPSRSETLHATA